MQVIYKNFTFWILRSKQRLKRGDKPVQSPLLLAAGLSLNSTPVCHSRTRQTVNAISLPSAAPAHARI